MTVLNPPTATADLARAANRPTAALADTLDRDLAITNAVANTGSGTLRVVPIYLPAGMKVTSITFISGSSGAGTPTNQWFSLWTSALALLGTTTDDTSTAWAANTAKTLSLSPSAITVGTTGIYLLGLVVVATTTPTLTGASSAVIPQGLAPQYNGTSTGGLTNPASAPGTAGAIAGTSGVPYAYVS